MMGVIGITVYNTRTDNALQLSDFALENVEALASGESGNNNCSGYRSWNVSGFLQRKKEFYDCACILRQGYSPSGNC